MRTLLILDGTHHVDEALKEASALCETGDKLTMLAISEKPPAEVIGMEPGPTMADPYTGGGIGGLASGGAEIPVLETDDDTERRVAGELRDSLDQHTAHADLDGLDVWTQAIVRDEPGEAVANYVRSSDIDRIVVPRSSLEHIRELLERDSGGETLDGTLAPVIVLPS